MGVSESESEADSRNQATPPTQAQRLDAGGGEGEEIALQPNKSNSDRTIAKTDSSFVDALSYFLANHIRMQQPKQQQSSLYPKAFEIDEELLNRLDKRARSQLSKFEVLIENPIVFTSQVRYPDLTTQRYSSLEQLYDRAGEKKDPKLLSVSWSITLVDPPGASAEIEALFETEDRLDTEERGLFMLYGGRARMSLTVSGPTEDWVEATFGELHPIIKAAEIGGIYKPLLIFRRQGVVWASSFTLAAVGSYAGAQYSSDVAAPQSPSERLNDILVNRTIDQRFEAFLRDFYIGLQADSVVPYAISIIAFMGLAMLGYVLFPKLIPRSTISIGLAKRRFAQHRNAFTFVIFTLGLLGIILPIIVNLLTSR